MVRRCGGLDFRFDWSFRPRTDLGWRWSVRELDAAASRSSRPSDVVTVLTQQVGDAIRTHQMGRADGDEEGALFLQHLLDLGHPVLVAVIQNGFPFLDRLAGRNACAASASVSPAAQASSSFLAGNMGLVAASFIAARRISSSFFVLACAFQLADLKFGRLQGAHIMNTAIVRHGVDLVVHAFFGIEH